jgi:hypothetical protein
MSITKPFVNLKYLCHSHQESSQTQEITKMIDPFISNRTLRNPKNFDHETNNRARNFEECYTQLVLNTQFTDGEEYFSNISTIADNTLNSQQLSQVSIVVWSLRSLAPYTLFTVQEITELALVHRFGYQLTSRNYLDFFLTMYDLLGSPVSDTVQLYRFWDYTAVLCEDAKAAKLYVEKAVNVITLPVTHAKIQEFVELEYIEQINNPFNN